MTVAMLVVIWSLCNPKWVYANTAVTPSTVTGSSVTVTGTCTDAVAEPTVVAQGVDQPISFTLGVMGSALTGGVGAGSQNWSVEWKPTFNGEYIIEVTCYPSGDPVGAESGAFDVDYDPLYSDLTVSPTNDNAGWMPFAVVPGTENLASVESGDLVLVLQDKNAQDEADAESVEEYFAAGTQFTISYNTNGRRPRANYCMADCGDWSYSSPTGKITSKVKTVKQKKSNGEEYASALGFLTSFSSKMDNVEGSTFSGIGVHYSDMSSTNPSDMSKRAGYSVNGFTGHTATFKMYAPDAVIAWMGINDPETEWTGFLDDSTTGVVRTITRQEGGWLMEFTFTFASNKKPASGPPESVEDFASYQLGNFYGVVFDDVLGGHSSVGGNNIGGGADYVSLSQSGDEICVSPPGDFSVTGVQVNQSEFIADVSCYTSTTGGRVDFGIIWNPLPTTTSVSSPSTSPLGQSQVFLSSQGSSVGYPSTGLHLTFPAGSVADGSSVTIQTLSSGETLSSSTGFKLLGEASEVSVRGPSGDLIRNFGPYAVRVCYDYSDIQLMHAGGDTANLEVLRNPGHGDETALSTNRKVDTAMRQICVDTTQMSTLGRGGRVPTALPVTGGFEASVLVWIAVAVSLLAGGLAFKRNSRSI